MKTRSELAMEFQARQRAKGLCSFCSSPLFTAYHCAKHAVAALGRARAARASTRVYQCRECGEMGHSQKTCAMRRAAAEQIHREQVAASEAVRADVPVPAPDVSEVRTPAPDHSPPAAFLAWRREKLRELVEGPRA